MAGKQGRPKRNTGVHNQSNVSKEGNEQVNPTIDKLAESKLHEDATYDQEAVQTEAPGSEKVLEVNTDSGKKAQRPRPLRRSKITHTVIVNGTTREISELAYKAIKRDPKIDISLPKGSVLAEPSVKKPCKDC